MFKFEEKIDALKKATRSGMSLRTFFEKRFDKFGLDDQFKILEMFSDLMVTIDNGNDWSKFLYYNPEICLSISKRINLKTNLSDNSISNETKSRIVESYFNIVFYCFYMDENKKDNLKLACDYINNMDFRGIDIKALSNLSMIILKQIKILSSEGLSLEKVKSMVLFYFESVDSIKEDDELLNLLIEMKNIIDVTDILNVITNKVQLENSESPVLKRLKNGLFSKEDCFQLLSSNSKLKRYANVDLIKHFLIENGIENPEVIYDKTYYIGGVARGNLIRIATNSVGITSFHEAIHIIQNKDLGKKYHGNRYYMLKDFIIAANIPNEVYRNNYKSLLFEEEAKQLGTQCYHQYYMGEKYDTPEILVNSYIAFGDGMKIEKKDLFDSIIHEKPEILTRYPILKVEYHDDGTRKTPEETISYLEQLNISSEEKQAIFECIFDNKYEKESEKENSL